MTIHSVMYWCENCQAPHSDILESPPGAEAIAAELFQVNRLMRDLTVVTQAFGGLLGYGRPVEMEKRGARKRPVQVPMSLLMGGGA